MILKIGDLIQITHIDNRYCLAIIVSTNLNYYYITKHNSMPSKLNLNSDIQVKVIENIFHIIRKGFYVFLEQHDLIREYSVQTKSYLQKTKYRTTYYYLKNTTITNWMTHIESFKKRNIDLVHLGVSYNIKILYFLSNYLKKYEINALL